MPDYIIPITTDENSRDVQESREPGIGCELAGDLKVVDQFERGVHEHVALWIGSQRYRHSSTLIGGPWELISQELVFPTSTFNVDSPACVAGGTDGLPKRFT
jgi:hypothetical protein